MPPRPDDDVLQHAADQHAADQYWLPVDLTSFEGRRTEVADAKRLIGEARLVTLTGVGGVGKTRLALRVAREVRRNFPDGVCWVELADLRDPSLLVQSVLDRFSVRERGGRDALSVLANHLRPRRLLLVLDNCEHLLDASAGLVESLLQVAPQLQILTTSRQALAVPGEQLMPISPLPVPEEGRDAELGSALTCASMALFQERAATYVPGFQITAENQHDVAELCRKLEGIPLAIELASVKVRVLSVAELAARLDARLELLAHSTRTGPSRHQTIQATIDWSFDLCTPNERLLWARASVFAGGLGVEAAEQVCSDELLPRGAVLETLAGLVDKSILSRAEVDGHIRFRLLEPLREHGHAELVRTEGLQKIQLAHLDWCAELVRQACMQWFGPAQERWCVVLRLEHANVRAAAVYALNHAELEERALSLLGDPWFLWVAMYLDEGRHWLERALRTSTRPSRARAKALSTAAYVAALQGDQDAAEKFLLESRAYTSQEGDTAGFAYASHLLGLSALFFDPDQSVTLLTEALPLYDDADVFDDYVVVARIQLGLALLFHGEIERAREQFTGCRELCQVTGEHWLLSYALYGLAFIAKLEGRLDEAIALLLEAVGVKRFFHDALGLALCLDLLAWVRAERGEVGDAALLLGAASQLWDSFGVRLFGSDHWLAEGLKAVDRCHLALGPTVYAQGFRTGERMPRSQVLAFVLGEVQAPHLAPDLSELTALTPREQQISGLIADGLSNKAIAERLVIAQRTAEGHVENILAKFGFRSRTQIAAWVGERRTAAAEI